MTDTEIVDQIVELLQKRASLQPTPTPTPTPTPIPTPIPLPTPVPVPVPVPVPINSGDIKITAFRPNHNSCVVEFEEVPGAVDYCAYSLGHKHNGEYIRKYSGGGLQIELNGLNPSLSVQSDYVLEALDKLGPFQEVFANTSHSSILHINGQGPSTNVPTVIASSLPFKPQTVTIPWPSTEGGESLFRDTFDSTEAEQTFNLVATPELSPKEALKSAGFWGQPVNHVRYKSTKWQVDFMGAEADTPYVVVHDRHLMDTYQDGAERNNYASAIITPLNESGKPVAFTLENNRKVHISFSVDAHFNPRRWCEVLFYPIGINPTNSGKVRFTDQWPNSTGHLIQWNIQADNHALEVIAFGEFFDQIDYTDGARNERYQKGKILSRKDPYFEYGINRPFNGTSADLDLRHQFDIYLSAEKYMLYEEGYLLKEGTWNVPLPFLTMNASLLHQVYHTGNEIPASQGGEGSETYWHDIQKKDQRHWGPVGFEYVPSFPIALSPV